MIERERGRERKKEIERETERWREKSFDTLGVLRFTVSVYMK